MSAPGVDLDGLLCALVLAPRAYSRNRFFRLFEDPRVRRVRRRAARLRGVVRQLAVAGANQPELLGEQVLEDGRWVIQYRVRGLGLTRAVALSALEAAVLRYALSRLGWGTLTSSDRSLVHQALSALAPELVTQVAPGCPAESDADPGAPAGTPGSG